MYLEIFKQNFNVYDEITKFRYIFKKDVNNTQVLKYVCNINVNDYRLFTNLYNILTSSSSIHNTWRIYHNSFYINYVRVNEFLEGVICPICLDNNNYNVILTECGHLYHKECFNKNSFHNLGCCICRFGQFSKITLEIDITSIKRNKYHILSIFKDTISCPNIMIYLFYTILFL